MRKYCLFEGGDVVGPFSAQELLKRAGFGSHSLVCPDEYSDEESYWKEAHFYEEFGFAPVSTPAEVATTEPDPAQSAQFLKEMDTVMSELSSFDMGEKASAAKEEPQKEEPAEPLPAQEKPLEKEVQGTKQIPQEQTSVSLTVTQSTSSARTGRKISAILLQASEEMKKEQEPAQTPKPATKPAPVSQMPVLQTPPVEDLAEPAPSQEQTAQEPPAVQPEVESVVRTISKINPLEEYFNTMRSGDLGNILGIPDPKENSDMSLARALQNQFEKTEPDLQPEAEEDPFDAFTSKSEPEEIEENLFHEKTLAETDEETKDILMRSLPDLQKAPSLKVVGQGPSKLDEPITRPKLVEEFEKDPEETEPPTLQEMIIPEQADDPEDRTVKTILEGTLRVDTQRREIPEPIKDVPADEAKEPAAAQAPAVSDDEEADFLQDRVVKQKGDGNKNFVFLIFGILLLVSGILLTWLGGAEQTPPAEKAQKTQETANPQAEEVVSAREIIGAMQAQQTKTPVELAKEIVQNYSLGAGRGTIAQYLQQRYQQELQSGYASMWSAEPLHKDVYVVKYRLAKTRKEPIVYIFQVDTAKKKLTGALNNITLDLVGKIR